jgi:hypothetical protein
MAEDRNLDISLSHRLADRTALSHRNRAEVGLIGGGGGAETVSWKRHITPTTTNAAARRHVALGRSLAMTNAME